MNAAKHKTAPTFEYRTGRGTVRVYADYPPTRRNGRRSLVKAQARTLSALNDATGQRVVLAADGRLIERGRCPGCGDITGHLSGYCPACYAERAIT